MVNKAEMSLWQQFFHEGEEKKPMPILKKVEMVLRSQKTPYEKKITLLECLKSRV